MLARLARWPFWTLLILLAPPLQAAEEKLAQTPADTTKPAEATKPPAASKKVPAAPPLDWKAGVATAKITPDTLMWMAGYGARKQPAEGTLQELFAKALALEDEGGQRVVIVTLDLIGVLVTIRESVEKQVQEQYQLPPSVLVLNASHTHCGPEYRERTGARKRPATITNSWKPRWCDWSARPWPICVRRG